MRRLISVVVLARLLGVGVYGDSSKLLSFPKEFSPEDRRVVINFQKPDSDGGGTQFIFSSEGAPQFNRNQVKSFSDGDVQQPVLASRIGLSRCGSFGKQQLLRDFRDTG